MKLLIHSNYAPQNFGGIERVVKQLINISEDYFDDIKCFFGVDSYYKNNINNNYNPIPIRILFKIKGISFLFFGNIRFIFHSYRANLIIYQEPYPSLWPSIFIINYLFKKKIICLIHADPNLGKFLKYIYIFIRSIVFKNCTIVLTSPNFNNYCFNINKNDTHIIPLGISDVSLKFDLLQRHGNYAIYFGRLAEYKGIDVLLKCILQIPDINFIIAGSGPLSKYIKNFIFINNIKNINFINDSIDETTKNNLIKNSRFLIFPSTNINEAFGLVQLEAMRLSIPIINTNLNTGVNFVAPHRLCAITVNPNNILELSNAIYLLWSDYSLCEYLSRNCRKRFIENFTDNIFMNNWKNLLDRKLN